MNISTFQTGANSGKMTSSGSLFAGGLPMLQGRGLKSTQEKLERQQKAAGQIDFWEKQKENLKNTDCASLEEIAKKLEQIHTYNDAIAGAKMAYNQEQMFHILDEAQEQGEKIAEEAKKKAPKTPEERKKEKLEEALGIEEESGLEELLPESADTENGLEKLLIELTDNDKEKDLNKNLTEELAEALKNEAAAMKNETAAAYKKEYIPLDIRI